MTLLSSIANNRGTAFKSICFFIDSQDYIKAFKLFAYFNELDYRKTMWLSKTDVYEVRDYDYEYSIPNQFKNTVYDIHLARVKK